MLSPECMTRTPVDVLERMVWVIIGSISILPSMYQSTIFGTSVRAARRRRRCPSRCAGDELERPGGNSWPAPATPMITDLPQRDARLRALAHDLGVPVQSKV